MSELRTKDRAEIVVILKRTRETFVFSGRYGTFYECYGYCAAQGYVLISYKAIY